MSGTGSGFPVRPPHYAVPLSLPAAFNASETGDLLVQHVLRLHGIPRDIVLDRVPQFTTQVWRSFGAALVASVRFSSGYHPQTNGRTERMNQTLGNAPCCVAARHPTTWNTYLSWVENGQNSLVFWHLSFHGGHGIPTPPLQLPGGRGSSPIGPGTPASMLEDLAADTFVPPTLIFLVSAAGTFVPSTLISLVSAAEEQASFTGTPLPPWATGLALSERPPLPSGVQEAGVTACGPLHSGSNGQPAAVRLRLLETRVHPTFHISRVKPVVEFDLSPPSRRPSPCSVHGWSTCVHCSGDPGRLPEGARFPVPCGL